MEWNGRESECRVHHQNDNEQIIKIDICFYIAKISNDVVLLASDASEFDKLSNSSVNPAFK